MKRFGAYVALLTLSSLPWICAFSAVPGSSSERAPFPLEGFVQVNGVRLQYLDWGGTGPALLLIHGLGGNPHAFDDLAPAFTDRFHVIAYARRGSGGSDVKGPYDIDTLTQDLRGLMDALAITKADLVGYSAGGDEITALAAEYPQRVDRIVYFDGGYEGSDPDAKALFAALPTDFFNPPASAMRSFDAYRSYEKAMLYGSLDDMARIEATLRDSVVIQQDGSVKERTPKEVVEALFAALTSNKRRDYAHIHCPALAIFADHHYDVNLSDAQRRAAVLAYEQTYWKPFQAKAIERMRRELANVQIVRVPGAHLSFYLTERRAVVNFMRPFLLEGR